MKILIADQFSELGGAQRVLLDLLPALGSQGWKCVLAVPDQGSLIARAQDLGVQCERITCGPFGCGSKSFADVLRFSRQFPELRTQFRNLLDQHKPDVFYVNAPRLVPAAGSLGNQIPPILFHAHNYLRRGYAQLTGRFLRRARASVVANCDFVLQPLRQYLAGSAVEVIHNGVPDCGPPKPRALTGRIGMIGRICPEKGQKVFVDAARIVAPYLPHSTFVICGATQFSDPTSEAYSKEVRERAAGLPIQFTGWRDDIADVLRTLDLLVVPSMPLAEATTRVIPEAFSAGVPVLASDLPGICEILKDGETGFLFPPGKAGALANRIREIMSAPPQTLAVVTAKARRQFEERFSIDVYRRRMIQSLERVGARALA